MFSLLVLESGRRGVPIETWRTTGTRAAQALGVLPAWFDACHPRGVTFTSEI